VAPDKGSVIVPEAITPKGEKAAEPAAPGAESDDAPAADAEKAE
jgi:small subunit ribosomal protein S16